MAARGACGLGRVREIMILGEEDAHTGARSELAGLTGENIHGHTSEGGVWSASETLACRLRRISLSVRRGRFSSSSTSNQSY
jgi:hypothetical protein